MERKTPAESHLYGVDQVSNDIPKQKKFHLTTFQIIILGFAGVILLGSLLLCLPISTRSGEWASYLDALFTATTSVCVTGLVTQDTGTYWSLFGQIIILILIQIGGMGVMTVAIMLGLMARRRRFSLMQRNTMQEAIGGPSLGNIIKLTKFIISVTAATEIAGAVCMFPVFIQEFGVLKSIWYSVFHSVSAFCNAGFDLMGKDGEYVSLTGYSGDWVVNLVIMLLIIISVAPLVTIPPVQSPVISVVVPKISLFSRVVASVEGSVVSSTGSVAGSVAGSVDGVVSSGVPAQAARDTTITAANSKANSFFISFPP